LTNTDESLPKVARVETEQEKDDQQLKQVSDTTAVLQYELIQATVRERQLRIQLDEMKDDVSQLKTWLQQRPDLWKEFKREREQKRKQRNTNSRFHWVSVKYFRLLIQMIS